MDPEVHQLVVKDDKNELTEQSVQKLKMKLKDLSTIVEMWAFQLEDLNITPEKENFDHIMSQFTQIKWLLQRESKVNVNDCEETTLLLKKISEKITTRTTEKFKHFNNSVVSFGNSRTFFRDVSINYSSHPQSTSAAQKLENSKTNNEQSKIDHEDGLS
ncbi:hypothetical protein TYRP_018452, partial [Tyrophagus putrescentiae]